MNQESKLETRLEYHFRDRGLLIHALSHSSYVNEQSQPRIASNERMEFLGDAVLGLVITRSLYDRYPKRPEGDLTLMKSVLVSRGTLSRCAQRLELGNFLLLGKGEAQSGGRERGSNLSNGFEALLAAIYLDGGLEAASTVILTLFHDELARIDSTRDVLNYKNLLQNYTQDIDGSIPVYTLVRSFGPPHEKLFEIQVRSGKSVLGTGTARTKKAAEQHAARAALLGLGERNSSRD